MITDDRIPNEVATALNVLQAIKEVYERDGMISERYLKEKAGIAQYVIEWLIGIAE